MPTVGPNPGMLADHDGGQEICIKDARELGIGSTLEECGLRNTGAIDENVKGPDGIEIKGLVLRMAEKVSGSSSQAEGLSWGQGGPR